MIPSLLIWVFYGVCFCFLTLALKKIEIGTAYAIWSGLGTAMIAVIGVFVFGESFSILKLAGLAAIIFGVVALHLAARP